MRTIVYLSQDEIDDMLQKHYTIYEAIYNSLRALQDKQLNEVTTAFTIYRRKDMTYD